MPAQSFILQTWVAWTPSIARVGDGQPPAILRRRVSALGQQALAAAWGIEASRAGRLIFASRHGEFGRTLSILDALAREEEVSPADFTLSVHHALTGLLSIAHGNRNGHTTIAAGAESFGFGMLESVSCLAERPAEPVLFVYFDEPLPDPYAGHSDDPTAPIALAISISAMGEGERFSFSFSPSNAPGGADQASAFLRFLQDRSSELVLPGDRMTWRWERLDAAA